ncbi:hypothetical protein N657DRAFT_362668 [Parathielavia appendiculata]|uniref:Uncharacterized protein n=1 Tax=Parathielavia appendiculata TaxID=2587402 RepID=A0AAN6Z5G1_9PEZI|nr:hypothetical protein N657DRAFT_362668 [Parathielavia appendiculata]
MNSSRNDTPTLSGLTSTDNLPDDTRAYIEQLSEELSLEQAVLESLYDLPESDAIEKDIATAKLRVADIKRRLKEARRKVNPTTCTSMVGQVFGRQLRDSERTQDRILSSLAVPTRKRQFESTLDARDPSNWSSAKRTTPSPGPSENDFLFDGFNRDRPEIIDLTECDDDEIPSTIIQRQRQAEERARRNKERADGDAELAKRLHGRPSPPPNGLSSLRQTQQNPVFHRMMGRSSHSSLTGHMKQEARPASGVDPHRDEFDKFRPPSRRLSGMHPQTAAVKPEPIERQYRMPGAYVNSDDERETFAPVTSQPNPRPSLPPLGSTFPLPASNTLVPRATLSTVPMNPALTPAGLGARDFRMPAIELARQASMGRQQPSQAWPPVGSHGRALEPPSNGYLPTPARQSFGAPSLGPSRPGFISNGAYYSQPGPDLEVVYPGSLSQAIKRVNKFDWDKLTDGDGNPFDTRLANYLQDFTEDPRKTEEEIQQLLSNIRPDMEIPEEDRGETPEAMKYPLYPHQQLALKWMTTMEEGTNKGGILADDMGLGKTISTLALMVSRRSSENIKTNLIIGPVALIKQWESEVKKKLKGGTHRLSTLLLHSKKRPYSEIKNYDVVLTTYGSLAAEWKRYTQHIEKMKEAAGYREEDDAELAKKCPLLHARSRFYRVILDEAQCVKNKDTQASRAVHRLTATYRWCLTGTPMMNGVSELYPLIRFLRIRPYSDYTQFQRTFRSLNPRSGGSDYSRDNAMRQLQAVLKAMMLRRMKDSMIDGKPILTLPPKTENSEYVVFSDDERQFYQELESKSQVQFNKYLRAGTVGKNYSNILVLLLRLRQACCHPHLTDFEVADAGSSDDQALARIDLAKDMDEAVVRRVKAVEAFECPICYDSVQEPLLVIPCGHDICTECLASITEKNAQDNIRSGDENGAPKCPVCRGLIDPAKVITLTIFRKVHAPEALAPEDAAPQQDGELSDSASSDDDESDTDSLGSIADFTVPENKVDEDKEEDEDADQEEVNGSGSNNNADIENDIDTVLDVALGSERSSAAKKQKKEVVKKRKKARGKAKAETKAEEFTPHKLKQLRIDADKNKEARRRYMRYLRDNWMDSSKVSQVIDILEQIQESDEKTIVFSQWTALLDMIESQLTYKLKLRFCRYTGKMSRNQRDEAVQDFVENPRTKVMLVSLRAGNAGLNLTVASRIIICDPFWNPFIEMQAVDRAHRIGQQREVKVHRILVKETVEDRILALQEKKRNLVEAALDEGQSKNVGRLSERELAYLFGVSPARR